MLPPNAHPAVHADLQGPGLGRAPGRLVENPSVRVSPIEIIPDFILKPLPKCGVKSHEDEKDPKPGSHLTSTHAY